MLDPLHTPETPRARRAFYAAVVVVAGAVWLCRAYLAPPPGVQLAFFGFILAAISLVAGWLGAAGGAIATASLAVINWLTTSVGWLGRRLTDVVRATGGVFSRAWSALRGLWTDVVRPALRALYRWVSEFRDWLTKKLAPVFRVLARIRERLRSLYQHVIRPILDVIETTRAVLRTLAALHVPFARALDRYLAEVESVITENYLRIVGYVNQITNVLNAIVTGDLLLQRLPFLRSLARDAPYWIRIFWNTQIAGGARPAPGLRNAEKLRYIDPQHFGEQLGAFYRSGGGEYADDINANALEWRRAARDPTAPAP